MLAGEAGNDEDLDWDNSRRRKLCTEYVCSCLPSLYYYYFAVLRKGC